MKTPFIVKYPDLYKGIYKSFNFLRNDVLKLYKPTGFIFALAYTIIIQLLSGNFAKTGKYVIFGYAMAALLCYLLWLVIQHLINNAGSNIKFIFPGKYFIRNENGRPCTLSLDKIDSDRFEFASESTAMITAELNIKAYKGGAWATTVEDKYKRNLSHILKNSLSIMLIKSKISGDYQGFTHILPVSAATWNKYLDSRIGDNKFLDFYIVPDKPNKIDNQPYGLILFSIANVSVNKDVKHNGNFSASLGDALEQAVVYHIEHYMKGLFKEFETVPVLLQNMSIMYLDFFKECATTTSRISNDGARIIAFEISNPNKQEVSQD